MRPAATVTPVRVTAVAVLASVLQDSAETTAAQASRHSVSCQPIIITLFLTLYNKSAGLCKVEAE